MTEEKESVRCCSGCGYVQHPDTGEWEYLENPGDTYRLTHTFLSKECLKDNLDESELETILSKHSNLPEKCGGADSKETASPYSEMPSNEIQSDGSKGLVMVVDDEELVGELLSYQLEDAGYGARVFKDGEEGINYFRENHSNIKIVLLDRTLIGKDGYECLKEMREMDPNIKAIMISGHQPDGEIQKEVEGGTLGYLTKPYKDEALIKTIEDMSADRPV